MYLIIIINGKVDANNNNSCFKMSYERIKQQLIRIKCIHMVVISQTPDSVLRRYYTD